MAKKQIPRRQAFFFRHRPYLNNKLGLGLVKSPLASFQTEIQLLQGETSLTPCGVSPESGPVRYKPRIQTVSSSHC